MSEDKNIYKDAAFMLLSSTEEDLETRLTKLVSD
jgi:hypothetical protein